MTKLAYFDQEAADLDDKLLVQGIEEGRVPTTCLLGGALVMEAAKANRDPCSICACPRRDKCGGRAQLETFDSIVLAGEAKQSTNNEASARRLERRSCAKDLIRAGMDATKRGRGRPKKEPL